MTTRALIFAFLLSLLQAAGAEGSGCRPLKLSERTAGRDKVDKVYRLNRTVSFLIGYDTALDTPVDFGARLMLLQGSAAASNRSYYSKGSADSYGMRPTFIANCGGNELLIFGEIGTEYSWGLRVFSYNGGQVKDLGDIPLAVEGESDAESVVPFMRFSQSGDSAIVSFTKDLIRNPGNPNERQISRSKAKYRISLNKLTEIQP
jgi:hypothetical protein